MADQSGNGKAGRSANTTWAATGKYGKALSFNGTSSRVTIPDAASLHLTTGMTLEAWVNPSTVERDWRDVIYKGDDNYYLEATLEPQRPAGGRGDHRRQLRRGVRHRQARRRHLDVSGGDL